MASFWALFHAVLLIVLDLVASFCKILDSFFCCFCGPWSGYTLRLQLMATCRGYIIPVVSHRTSTRAKATSAARRNLKNEILMHHVSWQVEILNETVGAEIAAPQQTRLRCQ
jgi:hypothetical protein